MGGMLVCLCQACYSFSAVSVFDIVWFFWNQISLVAYLTGICKVFSYVRIALFLIVNIHVTAFFFFLIEWVYFHWTIGKKEFSRHVLVVIWNTGKLCFLAKILVHTGSFWRNLMQIRLSGLSSTLCFYPLWLYFFVFNAYL